VITVVAASTNELDVIDWTHKRDILNQFGEYEIEELVGGKYYIAAYLDMNGDGQFNQGDYWGGYDANGDGRLDPVTLDGGKRLVVDIAFIGKVS